MATAPHSDNAGENAVPSGSAGVVRRPGGTKIWIGLELAAAFVLGVWLMNFLYLSPDGLPQTELGASGNDSYYHAKMAVLMPDIGLVREFPWLQFVWFTPFDDEFVSHHYGFHVLLMPFVHGAKALGYDYLSGGRWAISACFGAVVMLMMALLISAGIRWRWLWLLVFLVLPSDFFWRHSTIRAIAPSLVFMLGLLLAMFRNRPILAAVVVAAYGHLYLGAIVYTPVVVGCYVGASLLGDAAQRRGALRMGLYTMLGWLVGLRTYPYFGGALEFLRMQILGTGLNPDISVGAEWGSYGNVWEFATSVAGPVPVIWAASVTLRLRSGPKLDPRELTLTLMNFAFLLLTLKAKRFIEYWPMFCMLNAAFLAAPPINALAARMAVFFQHRDVRVAVTRAWVGAVLLGLAAVALLAPALLQVAGAHWLGRYAPPEPLGQHMAWWLGITAVAVAAGIGQLCWAGRIRAGVPGAAQPPSALPRAAVILSGGFIVLGAALLIAGPRLVTLQRSVRPSFDLHEVRDAMAYLESVSQPGDIVFTDDWDCFPVYFYYNSHNHYIVGLDPKFTHSRDPELWERFVRISRGQVPRTVEVAWTGSSALPEKRRIQIRLSDIREYFRAKYVVVDSDHKPLARVLSEAPTFAELIYPKADYAQCADAPYRIFRVHEAEPGAAEERTPPRPGEPLYLSDLIPAVVQQGWGELTPDRSVEGGALRLGKKFYRRGLGTHSPLELTYELPPGYVAFEAVVGINAGTGERGSAVVRVEVDGREAFCSPVLLGGDEGVAVRVDVAGAQRLTLRADPTSDGNRFDHVDWAEARLIAAGAKKEGDAHR